MIFFLVLIPKRFKNKYHPVDAKAQAKERKSGLKRRLRIFLDLLETKFLDSVSLDGDNCDEIVKLLDSGKKLLNESQTF